ncbi:RNA polymerase sigma factor [Parapedobacter deserti]|uniref:RNA polymerase sigma factor n=1 Tax=Parapedobacter deserti TaxID=1912957 RepID=A0ABV7JIS4_9SPHI
MSQTAETTDEKRLVLRLMDGDGLAFKLIYDSYKHGLGLRLLRLLKSEVLAEEVLQDVFLRVWERRATIDPEKSFRSYLYRVAENMVYDLFRRAAKEKEILQAIIAANSELYTHVEEALMKKESRAFLEDLLARLPNQRRKIFIACKLEGKSYKEVAAELGISTTTVNDHIQKAMQYLKANIHRVPTTFLMIIMLRFFHLAIQAGFLEK